MKYTILIYETPSEFAARTDPAAQAGYWGAYTAYGKALADAGVMVGGAGLLPPHAGTTLRVRDGRRHVQDGPFADTKEQLGGYYVIDVPDLDKALEWAARCPGAAAGGVEVRPHLTMG
ncbi:MAG: YciI family protein [Gemmataceae bacterium]|nr:YciI family protein [Gemmataceae bacterium]